jgi:hypothetical protein
MTNINESENSKRKWFFQNWSEKTESKKQKELEENKYYESLSAVTSGLFPLKRIKYITSEFEDNFERLFIAIEQKNVKRLLHFKRYYGIKYDRLTDMSRQFSSEYYHKLSTFIDEKILEFNEGKIGSEYKPSKSAKRNKDLLLNQEQTVLLFSYLQRVNIFDKTQKLNSKMAIAINVCTGWDKDKTRQLFSRVETDINKAKVKKAISLLLAEIQKEE